MSKGTYAEMMFNTDDYQLLMMAMSMAITVVRSDVYGTTGSNPNASRLNTQFLDLMSRIQDAKDQYQVNLEEDAKQATNAKMHPAKDHTKDHTDTKHAKGKAKVNNRADRADHVP